MNKYFLKKHGSVLTGRDYGKNVMNDIRAYLNENLSLDFSEVSSLGSSFGDEVVTPIAKYNGGSIDIYNVSSAIRATLKDVAEDGDINIFYK